MTTRPLNRHQRFEQRGVFDANGDLTLTLFTPPGPAREVRQITVSTDADPTADPIPTCTTYANGLEISHTLTGNNDTDSIPNTLLRPGDTLSAVWAGGAAGNIGTLTVFYDEVS